MKIGRIIILIVLILALAAAGFWYWTNRDNASASTPLAGSGTVETTEVTISPEISGQVKSVAVSEGDTVKKGDVLFELDDALLAAQRKQAQTNLTAAQSGLQAANTGVDAAQAAVNTALAQYNLALAGARQQSLPGRNAAWRQSEPAEFDQPVWYFTKSEQLSAANDEVNVASSALADAQSAFISLTSDPAYANLATVENRLSRARTAYLVASNVLDQAKLQDSQSLRDSAQNTFDSAKTELDDAQKAYDDLFSTQQAEDILSARANLASAQARYDSAVDSYNALLTDEDSLQVSVAAAALAQAKANVTAAQSKVAQAQAAIDQAQSALDLIDVEMEKLVVLSPESGVILVRNIEPGEVLPAGATALTLGQLDNLTITVYIPEDHYGEIKLGDTAKVKVDSFPNQTFDATVTRIANQAEFVPRNVQTEEGRKTTVFAVELAVQNPDGQLKPGMPADVTFTQP